MREVKIRRLIEHTSSVHWASTALLRTSTPKLLGHGEGRGHSRATGAAQGAPGDGREENLVGCGADDANGERERAREDGRQDDAPPGELQHSAGGTPGAAGPGRGTGRGRAGDRTQLNLCNELQGPSPGQEAVAAPCLCSAANPFCYTCLQLSEWRKAP